MKINYFQKNSQKMFSLKRSDESLIFYPILYIAENYVAHINNLKYKCFQITSGIWRTTVAVLARVAEIEVEQDNNESTRIVKTIESYSSKVTLPESESYLDVETNDVVAQVKSISKFHGFINISIN